MTTYQPTIDGTFISPKGNKSLRTYLTNGNDIMVSIIYPNGQYGRSATNTSGRVLVEFNIGWGCFQYYYTTIIERPTHGLVLDCGHRSDTTVSVNEMTRVIQWLTEAI